MVCFGVTTPSMRASWVCVGHGVQQRKIVAYANADSPRLRKVSIVVSAALPQTVALPVKRRAGHENQVHVVRFNRRTGFVRLPNAICAPAQVGRAAPPYTRASRPSPRIGQSQRLSGFQARRAAPHPEPIRPERPYKPSRPAPVDTLQATESAAAAALCRFLLRRLAQRPPRLPHPRAQFTFVHALM